MPEAAGAASGAQGLKCCGFRRPGLGCIRGFRSVFKGINFELSSGEALALTGPNGAGKSSLLRLLAGLLRPSAGEIALEGGAAERPSPSRRTISAISTPSSPR